MTLTIGLDLGTTNSCAAVYKPGIGPVVIETLDGANFMPSAVSFDRDGNILTGRAAVRNMADAPEHTFFNVKRLLAVKGGEDTELTDQQRRGEDGYICWQGPDKSHTSQELLSHIVKVILLAAEFKLGEMPTGVVATVPVDFHDPERRAVREAIMQAGIAEENIHLLEEPVAAAMCYALNDDDYKRNIVYDIGGGTFDCTIIRSRGGVHKPIMSGGSRLIGGSQIDALIAEQCIDAFREEKGHDLREMPYIMVPLLRAAEDAKIALSYNEEARIFLPNILSFPSDKLTDIEFDITVKDLETLSDEIVTATLTMCRDTLESAGYVPAQIDNVIMIGGQTRMPLIQKRVENFFGQKPIFESPEVAVAKGAAIYAAEKDGLIPPSLIQKTLNSNIGIQHENGNFVTLLEKGLKLPCEKKALIKKAHDPQDAFLIHLSQGDNRLAILNTLIFEERCVTDKERVDVIIRADEQGTVSLVVDGIPRYGE